MKITGFFCFLLQYVYSVPFLGPEFAAGLAGTGGSAVPPAKITNMSIFLLNFEVDLKTQSLNFFWRTKT
jgi:hypothetical protein